MVSMPLNMPGSRPYHPPPAHNPQLYSHRVSRRAACRCFPLVCLMVIKLMFITVASQAGESQSFFQVAHGLQAATFVGTLESPFVCAGTAAGFLLAFAVSAISSSRKTSRVFLVSSSTSAAVRPVVGIGSRTIWILVEILIFA